MKLGALVGSVSRNSGGLLSSLVGLHLHLAKLPGIRAEVLGFEDEFSTADAERWGNIQVLRFHPCAPGRLGYSAALGRAVLGGGYDLLHIHGLWQYRSVLGRQWRRRFRRPYVVSPHGMLDPWALQNSRWLKRAALALFERSHLRNAACVCALCVAEAQAVRRAGINNPIAIIPNGVDLPEVRSVPWGRDFAALNGLESGEGNAVWREAVESGKKVLLYLGRIHPKKGLVNLLKAWAAVQQPRHGSLSSRHPEWLLAIAGWEQDGHEADLKRLCEELGIWWSDIRTVGTRSDALPSARSNVPTLPRSHVLFLGPQFGAAKHACFASCSGLVLPSFSEGLPMAVLEACAHARPVLMTPQCNLPEAFAAGAALRVETDPAAIAAGLEAFFALTDAERAAMGAAGRQLVADRFAWPRIAAEMKQLYEWVLGGGGRPPTIADF